MTGRIDCVDNPQNVISFCTGYGGLELGIGRAGVDVRIVCNVEIEAFVQANLVAKTEEGRMADAPIWTDLKTFPASIFRGKVCGIIGGYPCQPFSSAGKRKGEEDPRHLWPYIRKHVRAVRPLWCFFENVQGHATMGLWRVLSDLEEEGYETTWGIFSAEEVGAPHQRKRVFILAKLPDSRSPHGGEVQFAEGRAEENAKEQESDRNGDKRGVGQLANPASGQPGESQARNGGQDIRGGSEEELGDTARLDGKQSNGETDQVRRACEEDRGSSDVRGTEWPARPGEEQYEWEEPRVTEAQSELGGSIDAGQGDDGVDATANRVDRLRLLGNGVVPQTAELAWRTLWKELNEKK
jgi:DNA (cytosine-5)-methyltransferase 1